MSIPTNAIAKFDRPLNVRDALLDISERIINYSPLWSLSDTSTGDIINLIRDYVDKGLTLQRIAAEDSVFLRVVAENPLTFSRAQDGLILSFIMRAMISQKGSDAATAASQYRRAATQKSITGPFIGWVSANWLLCDDCDKVWGHAEYAENAIDCDTTTIILCLCLAYNETPIDL